MSITVSRTWEVTPERGFVKVDYSPGDGYPVVHDFTILMGTGFALDEPRHSGFPDAVVPLLQGFDINWRSTSGGPAEHELRQLRIDIQTNGWHNAFGGAGLIEAGPVLRAIVGLRDNSGGDPPDDPFECWLHVSALVIFDYTIDGAPLGGPGPAIPHGPVVSG
ncbi:MAG: hypothetical protein M3400_14035 [Actinomycetota bacterium]|nr:hypothetical protein [Actinomycetota bacterium]